MDTGLLPHRQRRRCHWHRGDGYSGSARERAAHTSTGRVGEFQQAYVLHPDDIESRPAAPDASHQILVEILVREQPDHHGSRAQDGVNLLPTG